MNKLLAHIHQFLRFLLYLFIAWALGFAMFYVKLPQSVGVNTVKADAIVVLTGGKGRLEAGIKLLTNGSASRMLISGVHPDVVKHELSNLTGTSPALFDCCIDLDYAAGNTIGNATETAIWARKNGYKELILVTADYHIQRSIILFRSALPTTRIYPYPVEAQVGPLMLIKEYSKYLVTLLQEVITPNSNIEK